LRNLGKKREDKQILGIDGGGGKPSLCANRKKNNKRPNFVAKVGGVGAGSATNRIRISREKVPLEFLTHRGKKLLNIEKVSGKRLKEVRSRGATRTGMF